MGIDGVDIEKEGPEILVRALVEPVDPVGHCPDCGFDSTRVHSRPVSRVADVPLGGRLEVRVRKRRLWCDNSSCDRVTFTQTTDQVGLRARITTRLASRVVDALAVEMEGAAVALPTSGAKQFEVSHCW